MIKHEWGQWGLFNNLLYLSSTAKNVQFSMETVVGIILGAIGGFVLAYLKKKAQNLALLEDVRRLEEEKRAVEKKFVVEIEQVKKEHNLDIEHRKYQYEDKRRVYSNFCNELDKYQSQGQVVFEKRLKPMLNNLFSVIEQSNGSHESLEFSLTECFSEMVELCNDLNLAFVEVKNQTNQLRLSISNEAEELLNELLTNLEQTKDLSNEFLQNVVSPDVLRDKEGQAQLTGVLVELGKRNETIRSNLISQMKSELQSI